MQDSTNLLTRLDQSLHNSGLGKGERQAELVRLLLCKTWISRNPDVQIPENDDVALLELLEIVLKEVSKELPNLNIGKLNLGGDALVAAWGIFTGIETDSFSKSWAQDIFMKFGPQFLRKDLDQYFTPTQVVDFMCGVLDLKPTSRVIDPAGGSGDFLTGARNVLEEKANKATKLALHYWDQSQEASEIAQLNFWLHGAETVIEIKDSIKAAEDDEASMDFCITNPPFGTKTIWEAPRPLSDLGTYVLAHKWSGQKMTSELVRQQLGILFIERGIKLLKTGGILAIVLPSGYMSNPSESYLRRWLLEENRVLAVVSLPAGTFKKSGAGVTPDILFVKKGKTKNPYSILMCQAKTIGFDFKKQDTPPIYKLSETTGETILDDSGNPISNNDLIEISERFKAFANSESVSGLKSCASNYDFEIVSSSEVLESQDAILSPKRYSVDYLNLKNRLSSVETFTLESIGADVSNTSHFSRVQNQEYVYLDIGQIGRCSYGLDNKMRGWELPDRAKQEVAAGDILVSRLAGSANKFCLISASQDNLVATNGLWKIRVEDELTRLTILHFMFSKDYQIQIDALATGSIMEDVKEVDFTTKVLFPRKVDPNSLKQLKQFLEIQATFTQSLNS